MSAARAFASAVTLPDGRVLVAGGRAVAFAEVASAEIYDPVTGSWSPAGQMSAARVFHGATALADGRVLVVGGDGPEDPAMGAEVWDPATNIWTPTGPVRRIRSDPVVARLPDGRVLVAGGWDGEYQATAEIYDPVADTWVDAPSMRESRMGAGAATLSDGRVLVAGGRRWVNGHPDTSRTSEIFDPHTATWSRTGDLSTPRGEGTRMVVLADGRPAIVGGFWWAVVHEGTGGEPPTWSDRRYEDTAEIFAPSTGTWSKTTRMQRGRAGHVAVALADGTLLVAGGFGAGRLAERLGPAPVTPAPPTDAASPSPNAGGQPRGRVAFVRPRPRVLRASRTGRLTVKVRCGSGPCSDRLVLRSRRGTHRVLARRDFALVAGGKASLPLRLSRASRRRFAGRTVPVTLRLTGGRLTLRASLRMPAVRTGRARNRRA